MCASERWRQEWVHDKLPKPRWNSAQLHLFLCTGEGATTYNRDIKKMMESTAEPTGPETSHFQWPPPLEFTLIKEMKLSTNTKTIRLQFKAGSGSSTLLRAEQWNGPRSVILN